MKRSDLVMIAVALASVIGLVLVFVICFAFPELQGLGKPCGQLGSIPKMHPR